MNDKENNTQAFPSHDVDFDESAIRNTTVIENYHQGMTLRYYVAAKAMQGLLANSQDGYPIRCEVTPINVAKAALDYTDALLEALEKTTK